MGGGTSPSRVVGKTGSPGERLCGPSRGRTAWPHLSYCLELKAAELLRDALTTLYSQFIMKLHKGSGLAARARALCTY